MFGRKPKAKSLTAEKSARFRVIEGPELVQTFYVVCRGAVASKPSGWDKTKLDEIRFDKATDVRVAGPFARRAEAAQIAKVLNKAVAPKRAPRKDDRHNSRHNSPPKVTPRGRRVEYASNFAGLTKEDRDFVLFNIEYAAAKKAAEIAGPFPYCGVCNDTTCCNDETRCPFLNEKEMAF